MSYSPASNHSENVALGKVAGQTTWNKFGYNLDVDTGGEEIIASFGGTFSRMTSADTLDIVSSDANDTDGGTGVNSVVVYGVDENWAPQIEVVTLNGTTAVTTSNQWFGVNRIAIYLAGSGAVNAGTITATATTAATTQAEMPAGEGVTQQAIFFIGADQTFLATYLRINVNKLSGGGAPRVTVKGWVYSDVNKANQEVYQETIDTAVDNFITLNVSEPFVIGEKSILYFTATTDTNNTALSCRFSGKLVNV